MVRPVAAAAARQVTLRSHHTAYGTRSPAPTMTKNTEEPFSDPAVATSSAMTAGQRQPPSRSEEHTSELQSLMRISYAVFCLKKRNNTERHNNTQKQQQTNNKNNE